MKTRSSSYYTMRTENEKNYSIFDMFNIYYKSIDYFIGDGFVLTKVPLHGEMELRRLIASETRKSVQFF